MLGSLFIALDMDFAKFVEVIAARQRKPSDLQEQQQHRRDQQRQQMLMRRDQQQQQQQQQEKQQQEKQEEENRESERIRIQQQQQQQLERDKEEEVQRNKPLPLPQRQHPQHPREKQNFDKIWKYTVEESTNAIRHHLNGSTIVDNSPPTESPPRQRRQPLQLQQPRQVYQPTFPEPDGVHILPSRSPTLQTAAQPARTPLSASLSAPAGQRSGVAYNTNYFYHPTGSPYLLPPYQQPYGFPSLVSSKSAPTSTRAPAYTLSSPPVRFPHNPTTIYLFFFLSCAHM